MNQDTNIVGLELLQAMYNNNARQIDLLLYQNNELQRAITELIYNNSRPRRSFNTNILRYGIDNPSINTSRRQRQEVTPATSPATGPATSPATGLATAPATSLATGLATATATTATVTRTPNNTIRNRVYLNNLPYLVSDVQRIATIPLRNVDRDEQIAGRPTMDVSGNFYRTIEQLLNSAFLEPVNVYPTQQQINAATRNARYGDVVRPTNQSCPITLDTFNDNDEVTIIRHCSHIFSTSGISNWFRTNCKCPVCRYDIRNYDASSNMLHENNDSEQEEDAVEPTQYEESNLPNNSTLGEWLQNIINSNLNTSVDISNNHLDASHNTMDASYNQSVSFYFTYDEPSEPSAG